MSIATALFFMWGFLTSIERRHHPPPAKHLRAQQLSVAARKLRPFFGSYFLFALPAGKLIERIGYKRAMVVGLIVAGAGAILFLARLQHHRLLSLPGRARRSRRRNHLPPGRGKSYVVNLGPESTASSRLNLSQAFNSLGNPRSAPKFGGILILSGATLTAAKLHALSAADQAIYRTQQASSVRMPYLALGGTLLVLALALALLKMPTMNTDAHTPGLPSRCLRRSLTQRKHLETQVGRHGSHRHLRLRRSRSLHRQLPHPLPRSIQHRLHVRGHRLRLRHLLLGRSDGWPLHRLGSPSTRPPRLALCAAAVIAAALVLTTMYTNGHVAMWSVVAVGLFNSIMFPTIFSLGLTNLGSMTSKGSSLMDQAIVGGALLPSSRATSRTKSASARLHHPRPFATRTSLSSASQRGTGQQ